MTSTAPDYSHLDESHPLRNSDAARARYLDLVRDEYAAEFATTDDRALIHVGKGLIVALADDTYDVKRAEAVLRGIDAGVIDTLAAAALAFFAPATASVLMARPDAVTRRALASAFASAGVELADTSGSLLELYGVDE